MLPWPMELNLKRLRLFYILQSIVLESYSYNHEDKKLQK